MQMRCRGRQALGTHHAVDEPDGERQAVRVLEHAGQSLRCRVDLDLGALGDPPLREGDRLTGHVLVGSSLHSHSRCHVIGLRGSSLHLNVRDRVHLLHEVKREASIHS